MSEVREEWTDLLPADGKAKLTQTTTHYNQDMQKIITINRVSLKPGNKKTGNTLRGLMSLSFCCKIQMIGSEFM